MAIVRSVNENVAVEAPAADIVLQIAPPAQQIVEILARESEDPLLIAYAELARLEE